MLPLGTFADAFRFEYDVGPWVLRLPATIVFARSDRWWGKINDNVSEKVFDVSFIDDCITEHEYPEEMASQRKTNPF